MRLFRTVELNVAGWGMVLVLCLAGAGVGYLVAPMPGTTRLVAAAGGAVAALLTLVAVDRHRWRRMHVTYSWTDDAEEIARIGSLLREQGLAVELDSDPDGRLQLRFTFGHSRRVRRGLARAGVVAPPFR
jgi:hypothetical protein